MKDETVRKRYEKPSVTRVRLSVEHNVLQGCRGGFPNVTGADPTLCWVNQFCLKTPAE
jgi:hypothetical protein